MRFALYTEIQDSCQKWLNTMSGSIGKQCCQTALEILMVQKFRPNLPFLLSVQDKYILCLK